MKLLHKEKIKNEINFCDEVSHEILTGAKGYRFMMNCIIHLIKS